MYLKNEEDVWYIFFFCFIIGVLIGKCDFDVNRCEIYVWCFVENGIIKAYGFFLFLYIIFECFLFYFLLRLGCIYYYDM